MSSKAYFTIGNAYGLSRGKKGTLVMSPADETSRSAINRSAGTDSLDGGKKVYVTLEDEGHMYVLDPSKSKGKELVWSKSLSLSGNQSFRINILDGKPFGTGSTFGLSYKGGHKTTRHLCFGDGADPLPKLSESSDNMMRLTVTEIEVESGSECSMAEELPSAELAETIIEDVAEAAPEYETVGPGAAEEIRPDEALEPCVPTLPSGESDVIENPAVISYEVQFMEGSLGVKLKRSKHGTLLVQDIIPNSQAVGKGIEIGDKFCCIGTKNVSDHPIEDEEFNSIVGIIKEHERPLPIRFERPRPMDSPNNNQISHLPAEEHKDSVSSAAVMNQPEPSAQEIEDMNALKRLAERLVLNEGGRSSVVAGGLAGIAAAISKPRASSLPESVDHTASQKTKGQFHVVQKGRRIVKHGELDVLGRGTLWNAKCSKYIFLMSDVILITVVKGKNFHLETVIDHQVCRLNPNPRDNAAGKIEAPRFDILWPGGIVEIVFKDASEREIWGRSLSDTICHSVFGGKDTLSFGWRHLYMHGTLHSAVLNRDEAAVRAIIADCEDGSMDSSVLDARDDDLYTPLHLACILRLPNIAKLLLNSDIDCTIPDAFGRTAFHWCAAQLDYITLELLCTRVFDVDLLDDKERTPLYIACVEGRDAQGRTDVDALCKIILLLTEAGASVASFDSAGWSILHYLSASLQYTAVEALLKAKACVNLVADNEFSWSPLHVACSCTALKPAIGEGYRILHPESDSGGNPQVEPLYVSDIGRTIGVLLKYGAWPNMRAGKDKCTPLQLLANADGVGGPLFEIAGSLLLTSGSRADESILGKNDKYVDARDELIKCHEEWNRRGLIDASSTALW